MIYEKTGKRCLKYSTRHRSYGANVTMMDIDSLEYDRNTKQPLAIIETKLGFIKQIDLNDPRLEVMQVMANMPSKQLPMMVLVYYPLDSNDQICDANDSYDKMVHMQYLVIPVNEAAKEHFKTPCKVTELQWVNWLRKLHGEDPTMNNFSTTWRKVVYLPKIIEKTL